MPLHQLPHTGGCYEGGLLRKGVAASEVLDGDATWRNLVLGPPLPRAPGWLGGGRGLALTVKTCGFRTIWNSLRMPRIVAEVVSSTAARTPPSTRAGGQDDVS